MFHQSLGSLQSRCLFHKVLLAFLQCFFLFSAPYLLPPPSPFKNLYPGKPLEQQEFLSLGKKRGGVQSFFCFILSYTRSVIYYSSTRCPNMIGALIMLGTIQTCEDVVPTLQSFQKKTLQQLKRETYNCNYFLNYFYFPPTSNWLTSYGIMSCESSKLLCTDPQKLIGTL